jgi:hypothetical protein
VFNGDKNVKKPIVIGGSNGIGLAITKYLIDKGYYDKSYLTRTVIIDIKKEPKELL